MTISRKKHSTQTKVKVVLEALKGEKTTAEMTAKYGIHSTQINNWKKAALDGLLRPLCIDITRITKQPPAKRRVG